MINILVKQINQKINAGKGFLLVPLVDDCMEAGLNEMNESLQLTNERVGVRQTK